MPRAAFFGPRHSESDVYFVFVVPPSGGNRRSGTCEFRLKAGLQTSNIDKVSAIGASALPLTILD